MKKLLILITLLLLIVSCQSQSGLRQTEKVVIIDSKPTISTSTHRMYKVKRINQGVVTWITIPTAFMYESGDTILYSFGN